MPVCVLLSMTQSSLVQKLLSSKHLRQLERKLHHATMMFQQHVPVTVPATQGFITQENPCLSQSIPMSSIQTLVYNDDGEYYDENDNDSS